MSVNIDKETYEKSKKLGVNVSQACTNYLKFLNSQIEATLSAKEGFLGKASFTKEGLVRSPGFEPGSSTWQGTAEDWSSFRVWLEKKNYRGSYPTTLYNYAMQYSDCLFKRDLSRIRDMPDSIRPNILKALSALSKFAGVYEDWKILLKNYDLSWGGRSADDIIIDRITSTEDPNEVWVWIKSVKQERPELTELLDLMAVSGLRFIEGINSFNIIIGLSKQGKLILDRTGKEYRSGYYNRELSSLEHFWIKDANGKSVFLRCSKKAFVSFVPEQLVTRITEMEQLPNDDAVQKMVQKRGLPLRFGDIREAHGTLMTKHLKESEINFLHGRVTSGVFMQHYFNPALIGDLKARVFRGIAEIQEKVKV